MKSEIEDLGITIDEGITVEVFNSLDLTFTQFFGISSHETRNKTKLPTLESLIKSLEDKELQMRNQNKSMANYDKPLRGKKDQSPSNQPEDSQDLEPGLKTKCKFCEKQQRTNEYWHLQAECHYCHETSRIAEFCKKNISL